jgi:hypothetical protein
MGMRPREVLREKGTPYAELGLAADHWTDDQNIWLPLKKRAGVRQLDLYSLRHTFASLGRTAGESAFNVARMVGHSRSTLVDQCGLARSAMGCREISW